MSRSDFFRRSGFSTCALVRFLAIALAQLLFTGSLIASQIVVNDRSDATHSTGCAATGLGTCTLRDAILFANSNPGPDAILFDIPGSGTHTIQPTTPLPPLTDD